MILTIKELIQVKELEYLVNKLLMQKIVAFDTETEGLDSLDTEIVGISFSWIEKGVLCSN